MAGTYGMRAVPLRPSYDLVVAGKAGMDGLWSAALLSDSLAGKGLNYDLTPAKWASGNSTMRFSVEN